MVWLRAPRGLLWARVQAGREPERPLASDEDAFGRLLTAREALYAQVASAMVVSDERRPLEQVADDVAMLAAAAGARCARPAGAAGA